jgi:hypothetical protein
MVYDRSKSSDLSIAKQVIVYDISLTCRQYSTDTDSCAFNPCLVLSTHKMGIFIYKSSSGS